MMSTCTARGSGSGSGSGRRWVAGGVRAGLAEGRGLLELSEAVGAGLVAHGDAEGAVAEVLAWLEKDAKESGNRVSNNRGGGGGLAGFETNTARVIDNQHRIYIRHAVFLFFVSSFEYRARAVSVIRHTIRCVSVFHVVF